MKKIFYCLMLLLPATVGFAQEYGHEWIDYNKQYYKIPVGQDGIYRISYADLVSAGFPVNSVDPRRLQLFHQGEEQAIYVEGQGDAIFNTTDYIEFYGRRNDGSIDSELYQPAEAQPHQYYNIYSDTSVYFLTYHLGPTTGKRMASFSENNINGLSPEASHNQAVVQVNTDQYSGGRSFNTSDVTKYTWFDYGEGWTGKLIQEGQSVDYTLTGITAAVQASGNPVLQVLLVGRDDVEHQAEVFAGAASGSLRSLGTVQFDLYNAHLFEQEISWSDISAAGEIFVRIDAQGITGSNDRLSTSYIRVVFPQNFDMQGVDNKKFVLKTNTGDKSWVEIQNAPASANIYDITDPNNVVRIGYSTAGTSATAMINNTSVSRTLWVNGTGYLTPVLKRVQFSEIDPANYNYIIVSHSILMKPTGGVDDPVAAYADYRASAAGGSYDVLTADMQMLYNQFAYGQPGPLALYRFMRFMVDNGNPQYLFLIGKGLDPSLNYHRRTPDYFPLTRFGVTHQLRDLVPVAGSPGSDITFTAGLNGTKYEAAVPVGRIPATMPSQVLAYLGKVKEMESLPYEALWRKRILHLSGGISTAELSLFRTYTDGFGDVAEGHFLGGDVKTISKESNSTIELINVADEVNNGLNLVTFFGHSAPSVTDIDIGFVSDPVLGYNNPGKYPMFLVNGCNAGQFFSANVLFGEDWILADDKGAVGFIAHSSYGFASNLRKYSDIFYSTGYGDSVFISKGIGNIQQEVSKRYMASSSESPANITQVQQMVLLGDPAVMLFGAEHPDYEVNEDNLYIESFTGEPVSARLDSFAIKAIVRNFGRTRSADMKVRVTRTMSDNSTLVYDSIFPSVFFQDTITMVMKNESLTGYGNNQFRIELDYANDIEEESEGNNTATLNAFVPLYGTKNLYPLDFSIVPSTDAELMVQTTDILSDTRDFVIEIDTVSTFDSPYRRQQTVSAKLLASWTPGLLSEDSLVYFWRSKLADASGDDEWDRSSFIYIENGPEGWSQSKFSQYEYNALAGLERNEDARKLDFESNELHIYVKTYGANHPATNLDVSVELNGAPYIINNGRPCRNNSVNLIAFDKTTTVPYAPLPLSISNQRTCGRLPQVINNFTFSELEAGTESLLNSIDNIGAADSVVLFTIGNPDYASWSAAVKAKLEEIGASAANIEALQNGEPYILLGRKGAAVGTALEVKATTDPVDEQEIELNQVITGVFSSGNMLSGLIGPASSWQTLLTNVAISEIPQTDVYGIDVFGITAGGNEVLLRTGETAKQVDISSIDADQYPFLRLKYNIEDNDNLTPAQLKKWQVTYTGVPEGILLVGDEAAQSKVLQEGAEAEASFGFMNLSVHAFPDSIPARYTLFNQESRTSDTKTLKIKSPAPGDTTTFDIKFSSLGKAGLNDLNVFVNPREVPEQYFDNNMFDAKSYLTVNKDNINPLIDVVFDGVYIMDGDIVSPSPLISVQMKDENQYLLKKDTADVNIFLKHPCETCEFERISFSSPRVEWSPATTENNFRVEYQPEMLENGKYTLRVEAKDASGNASGARPYTISFEVVNESSITNFYPYPNPFSSNTRFIFTLTGSDIPDEIKIQIMTVSGKVVREITGSELGPVRIGNNISDYAWDGKDEFGDQLANGVYLYRVIVKNNGQTLDHRSTSADKAFKNGFGKLYLLR